MARLYSAWWLGYIQPGLALATVCTKYSMRHDTNNVTDTEVTAAVTVVCISADPG